MLLLLLFVIEFLSGSAIDPVVWAGGFVGQGFYSGGRLIADSIAGSGKVAAAIRRQGARRAANA